MPPSEKSPSVAVRSSSETIDDAAGRSMNGAGQSTTNNRGSSACARTYQSQDYGLADRDSRRDWTDTREEQLVVQLQEYLTHMTQLRDWLGLLDQELG